MINRFPATYIVTSGPLSGFEAQPFCVKSLKREGGGLRASARTCCLISLVGVKWLCLRINQQALLLVGTGFEADSRHALQVERLNRDTLSIVLQEGRNRQIRKMMEVFFFFCIALEPRVK